ncbi:hypothetical protein FGO68_gene3906 [Halteria grandinella]|uniref:Uncharacterized protein n=1 Tax=Halteria grandinella TaxID=5974 RepID=A0A8J8NQU7_HALGN|nr:hypothetical protein FGO68_gene3906 [Halteria grandinella]
MRIEDDIMTPQQRLQQREKALSIYEPNYRYVKFEKSIQRIQRLKEIQLTEDQVIGQSGSGTIGVAK